MPGCPLHGTAADAPSPSRAYEGGGFFWACMPPLVNLASLPRLSHMLAVSDHMLAVSDHWSTVMYANCAKSAPGK